MEKNENFFSLEWFKEKMETSVDRVLEKRISKLINKIAEEPEKGSVKNESPYINLKLVNDSLTVVFTDGSIINKPNATEEDYNKIKICKNKQEILNVIYDKQVAIIKKEQKKKAKKLVAMAKGFKLLSKLNDFQVSENSVSLKGTSRTIPPLLVTKFIEIVGKYPLDGIEKKLLKDDEYQGLKNFFMWCCLNPRAEVANSLYEFLSKNGMKITKQGFFVALRNVVVVQNTDESKIVDFISNAYNKVKAIWKHNPDDYRIVKCDGEYYTLERVDSLDCDGVIMGNLTTMYLDLPNMNENRYTDNWTHTFDIRIGQVVSMPSAKCDWSTQDCARAGLHFAGHTAPYVLCGDTTVFTLHNPMKVVGIGTEKGRCWEYLPFMTTNIKEANEIMNSEVFDFLQLDEEYAIKELEGLLEKAKEGFTVESNKHSFNLPSISTREIRSIVLSLTEMKKTITKRVSNID